MLVSVRPQLLADLLCKALAAATSRPLTVVARQEVAELPWRGPWDVALLSTSALTLTGDTGDAYVLWVPGDVPSRVEATDPDALVDLVCELALRRSGAR